MKKIYIVCIALCCLHAFHRLKAEDYNMVIHLKNETTTSQKVSLLKVMTFLSPEFTIYNFDGTNSVFNMTEIKNISFETSTLVSETGKTSAISLYPNPTSGLVRFKNLPAETSILKVYNMSGVEVFTARVNATVESINISFLPKGVYFIRINKEISKLIKL